MQNTHYLKKELYEKIKKDSTIFDFLEDNSLDGLWYWDLENIENEWMSPKFWEILGYEANEKKHLCSQWKEIIFPEDLEEANKNFYLHLKDSNHPYDQIVRYVHKKGHTVWVRCRGKIIKDTNGKPIRMIGAHNDITQQKNDENNLKNITDELRAIIDSSLNGIAAFKPFFDEKGEIVDFIFTMVNREACKIVNLDKEEIIGQRLSILQPANFKPLDSLNRKTLFEIYKEVVLSGESKSLEFYFESDGIKEWFKNKSVKYNNGFVCTFEIITKEKLFQEKLEQQLKEEIEKQCKQQELLIQQSKMTSMGEMIGAIAHNWRQPLNTLSLLCITVIDKFENSNLNKEYLYKWIGKVKKQLDFMSHTIDDFRNFHKPKEEFKKIFLKEIILKIVTLISYEFKINNIQININIPESISFICLENQLQQALINILLNAKDAIISNNIKNGMVNINAEKNDSSIILIIKDNAGGIKDSKILKRIFEPYFTTKNQSHGTGIGLYMTKIIIEENLEGNIEVKNIKNGLEFKIQLPILIK